MADLAVVARSVRTSRGLLLVVFVAALALRLVYVFWSVPYSTPDTETYLTVAENILRNLCVSRSDPISGICKPSWGGNHLPGYPLFVALAWKVGGSSDLAILVAQSLLSSLAIARITFAVLVYARSHHMALIAGLILAASPLELGLSRLLLTEALAVATTLWVMAELILSLAERRLRVIPLSLALIFAVFVRHDAVLLCLVAAGVGLYLYPLHTALLRVGALALIVAIPVCAWGYRSIAAGLPYFPPVATAGQEFPPPAHILQWGMTWIQTSEEAAKFIFPFLEARYDAVRIPSNTYISSAEQASVERHLASLAALTGQPVPADTDAAFAPLVSERRTSFPLRTFVQKPLARLVFLGGDVYFSYGWPIGFGARQALEMADIIKSGGTVGLIRVVTEYPLQTIGKAAVNCYKFLMLGIFAIALWRCGRQPVVAFREIILMTGAYAGLRMAAIASGALPTMEVRFLIEGMPGLEISCVLASVALVQAFRANWPAKL